MNIYVDTGFLYALADKRDKHHQEAESIYLNNIGRVSFLISDYVFVETWLLIHHKLGSKAAMTFWESIEEGALQLIRVEDSDLKQAKQIAEKYHDQDFTLVDCVSFSIMERLGIDTVFSFDSDFYIYKTSSGKSFHVQP